MAFWIKSIKSTEIQTAFDCVFGIFYRKSATGFAQLLVDLVVVTPFIGFVAEEIDFIVLLQESQAVSFVPTDGEHIKTDLASDRVLDSQIRELFLESSYEIFANRKLQVVFFVLISFFLRTVSSNRRNVDKSSTVLNKSASFDWNIEISDVMQAEVDEFLEFVLSQVVLDALSEWHSLLTWR